MTQVNIIKVIRLSKKPLGYIEFTSPLAPLLPGLTIPGIVPGLGAA